MLYNPELNTCDWQGNVNCTCRGACSGGPPDGTYENSFPEPDTDDGSEHLPPAVGEGAPDGIPDELPQPPQQPPVGRPPVGRPPVGYPPHNPQPQPPVHQPGPPNPNCVDCKYGDVGKKCGNGIRLLARNN